jgi:hypothetical protein
MNNFKWGITAAIAAMIVSVGLGLLSGVGIGHVFIRALIFGLVFFGFGFGLRFMINSFFPEILFMEEETYTQESFDQPGSRVNITLDNTGEFAVPELYKTPGEPDELGNIEDLVSGVFRPRTDSAQQRPSPGIDRKREESYNREESFNIGSDFQSTPDQDDMAFPDMPSFDEPKVESPGAENPRAEKPNVEKPVFTPSFGDDGGVGGLPDLESFAMAFSGGGEFRPSPPAASAAAGNFGGTPVPDAPEEFEPTQPARYVASKPTPLKGDFNPKDLAKGISTVLSKDKK